MQQIVGYKPEFCLIVIYIRHQSAVDYLQWDIESTLKLDCKGANDLMGPSCPYSELKYHDDTIYEGYISSWFTLVHKGILVITQGCTKDS